MKPPLVLDRVHKVRVYTDYTVVELEDGDIMIIEYTGLKRICHQKTVYRGEEELYREHGYEPVEEGDMIAIIRKCEEMET